MRFRPGYAKKVGSESTPIPLEAGYGFHGPCEVAEQPEAIANVFSAERETQMKSRKRFY
jgi:hypothetical protein